MYSCTAVLCRWLAPFFLRKTTQKNFEQLLFYGLILHTPYRDIKRALDRGFRFSLKKNCLITPLGVLWIRGVVS